MNNMSCELYLKAIKINTHLLCHSFHGTWFQNSFEGPCPGSFTSYSQGVISAVFSSGGLNGEKFASNLTQVAGRINLLASVEPKNKLLSAPEGHSPLHGQFTTCCFLL
jgi:hypothetical protein